MKFELKTNNEEFSKPFIKLFVALISISMLFIFSSIAFNLRNISRHYEINFLCKLLTVEKSSSNFKKLLKLTSQTSRQKVWELCKEIIN